MSRNRLAAAVATAATVLLIAGCTSNDNPEPQTTPVLPDTTVAETTAAAETTTRGTGGVYAPTDTAVGASGLEASILSVEDATSSYGPVVVITFQIVNTTDEVWEGYNWMTPSVVYGEAGMPAEHVISSADGLGAGVVGVIPPGARQTVRHAYEASKAELNPAVVTASSVVWQGDFSTFTR